MRRKTWLKTLPILLLTAAASGCAEKDELSCTAPHGAEAVAFQYVPYAVRASLQARLGDVAAPGEDFDATDVVETGRSWRYAFFWRAAKRWVVATEHGGVGYNNPVFAFDMSEDDLSATFVTEQTALPETLCETASDLLSMPAPKP